MSPEKATVSIDGEWLLTRLQEIEYVLDEIRAKAADGAFVKEPRQDRARSRPRSRDGTPVFPRSRSGILNIDGIEWKLKGSEPARVDDPWAWAFAYDQDGVALPETDELLEALDRDDKVQVGIYEITLSGTDKSLLSRKIPKTKGRSPR